MKTKILKKFGAGLLAFMMMFTLMPTTNVHAEEPEVTTFGTKAITQRTVTLNLSKVQGDPLDNNNQEIKAVNGVYDRLDSEGWKWDTNTDILILNGANFNTGENPALILQEKGTTIILEGENTFVSKGGGSTLSLSNEVTIKGSGKASISNEEFSGIALNDADADGDSMLNIEGGIFDIASKKSAIISIGGLTISGGEINARCETDVAIWAGLDMAITGGVIKANSTNSNGIGTDKNLSISNGADITATGYYPGLWSKTNISITDSTVVSTATADWGVWSNGTLSIVGNSDVTAIGATGSIGASTSSVVTPATNKKVEILSGTDKDSAVAVENSPFAVETDISSYGPQKYFHSKTYDKYTVTVNNGTGTDEYAKGAVVTISANTPATGKQFKEWTVVSGGVTLANAKNATTTFTMTENDVEVTATYENVPLSDREKVDEAKPLAESAITGITPTNSTTAGNILDAVTAGISSVDGVTASWKTGSPVIDKATSSKAGSITGTIVLTSGSETVEVTVNKVISKLPKTDKEKVDVAKPLAESAITAITATNSTTAGNILDAVKTGIASVNGVKASWKSGSPTITPATSSKAGSITGTIVLTSGSETVEVTVNKVIDKLSSKEVIVDNSTGTKIEYENGSAFDSDIQLVVTPKTNEEMKKFQAGVDKVAKGLSIAGVYDIKLLKNGVEVQPNGKLKITLPLTAEMKGMSDLQVVYIDDAGNVTIIPSQLIDGKLVFVTDHFSYYGVIGKAKSTGQIQPETPSKPKAPQTGDTSSTALYLGLIILSGCIAGFGFKKKKALRK